MGPAELEAARCLDRIGCSQAVANPNFGRQFDDVPAPRSAPARHRPGRGAGLLLRLRNRRRARAAQSPRLPPLRRRGLPRLQVAVRRVRPALDVPEPRPHLRRRRHGLRDLPAAQRARGGQRARAAAALVSQRLAPAPGARRAAGVGRGRHLRAHRPRGRGHRGVPGSGTGGGAERRSSALAGRAATSPARFPPKSPTTAATGCAVRSARPAFSAG
jgi:hypothetical protein